MIRNVGTLDRWIRVVLGIALVTIVFVGPRTPWGWLGILPVLSGLVGYCPLYQLFRLSTTRTDRAHPA